LIDFSDLRELMLKEITFSFSRSSGPGGQNVNKVNSKATLRWDVKSSSLLSPGVRFRLLQKVATKLTSEGELIVTSELSRDQKINKEECIDKLLQLIKSVWVPPKKRRKTKPSKSSVRERLSVKKKHGDKKKNRARYSGGSE